MINWELLTYVFIAELYIQAVQNLPQFQNYFHDM